MYSQKLLRIIIYTILVILVYFLTEILLSSPSQEVEVTEVEIQRFSRYGFVFPSPFNRTCSSKFLELPVSLVKTCANRTGDPSSLCSSLTCHNLLYGEDPQLHELALNFTRNLTTTPVSNEQVINETTDCAAFRRRRGFRDVVDPETADFPIAYNILTHTHANQLIRLLRAIYRPNNLICIHVDTKASEIYRATVDAIVRCFDNIRLASRMETIVWAGYSRLQADINCMKVRIDHICMFSEQ